MPDEGGVQLVGLDDALRDMKRWADQLGPAVEKQSRGFAGRVASRVSGRVPHLTGALAASVGLLEVTGDDDGIGIVEGEGLDYAGWIEFGGSRGRPAIPAGRYLYPTALEADAEWQGQAEQVAESTIGGFSWSTAAA